MLPKSFFLLMLPLGVAAVARPDLYEGLIGAGRPAETRPAAAPEPAGARRLIPARDGHYRVNGRAEGRHLELLVDTGATVVTLSWETGRALGLVRPGDVMDAPVATANGTVRGRRVTLPRLEVEGLAVASVDAVVMPPGALAGNLLGMSYLSRLRRFEFSRNALMLEQ